MTACCILRKMKKNLPIAFAVVAALFYSLNAPLSKLLLEEISSTIMAGLLYLGAGGGMLVLAIIRKAAGDGGKEFHLTRKDLPYTLAMVILDIAAPISLMAGLRLTNAESVALLNNFEIVATSLIALIIFKERIGLKLSLAIVLITAASIMLSADDISRFSFSPSALLVILASIFWGFENNCTRMLSKSDPIEIVAIKGFGSGTGSLLIAFFMKESPPSSTLVVSALLLGFVSYGLSIFFYVYAQRYLGAARTSAYYALNPFIGVLLSLIIFKEMPEPSFWIALGVMALGTYLTTRS